MELLGCAVLCDVMPVAVGMCRAVCCVMPGADSRVCRSFRMLNWSRYPLQWVIGKVADAIRAHYDPFMR